MAHFVRPWRGTTVGIANIAVTKAARTKAAVATAALAVVLVLAGCSSSGSPGVSTSSSTASTTSAQPATGGCSKLKTSRTVTGVLTFGAIKHGMNIGGETGKVYYLPVAVTNHSSSAASYSFAVTASSKSGRPLGIGVKCVLDVASGQTVHKKVVLRGPGFSEPTKQELANAKISVTKDGVERFPVGIASS